MKLTSLLMSLAVATACFTATTNVSALGRLDLGWTLAGTSIATSDDNLTALKSGLTPKDPNNFLGGRVGFTAGLVVYEGDVNDFTVGIQGSYGLNARNESYRISPISKLHANSKGVFEADDTLSSTRFGGFVRMTSGTPIVAALVTEINGGVRHMSRDVKYKVHVSQLTIENISETTSAPYYGAYVGVRFLDRFELGLGLEGSKVGDASLSETSLTFTYHF